MTDEELANDTARFTGDRLATLVEHGVRSTHPADPDHWAVEYLAAEMVVTTDDAGALEEELAGRRVEWRLIDPDPADEMDGTVGYRIGPGSGFQGDVDSLRLAAEINEVRTSHGLSKLAISAHYVPSIARTKIGPGSDPWPAEPGSSWRGGPPVTDASAIGIVDTGVWEAIPIPIADPGGPADSDPIDANPANQVVDYPGAGHGGFIAGVIEEAAAGIPLISRRAYVPGRPFMTERSVRLAGDEAVEAGARILNLSLGTYADHPIVLDRAVRRWVERGCLVVAAAGNEGTTKRWYPAGWATDHELDHGIVSVGACNDGAIASFSNRGDWVVCWAPGSRLLGLYPQDVVFPYRPQGESAPFDLGLARWSGTSFAAPLVAAEIARYAADNGFGTDVQGAWVSMRDEGYRSSCEITDNGAGYPAQAD